VAGDELWLDPQRAYQGAKDLAATGKNMKSQKDSLGGQIAAGSAKPPWGNDDIGAAFEQNYRKLETQFLEGWEKIAGYVEGLGYAAAQAVTDTMAADQRASQRIHGSYKPI
jgi:hypothetical protein